MFNNREGSISRRLTSLNMLVSGVALLTACAAFIGYDVASFRTAAVRNLSIRAQIIGSNCVPALLFNDRESAEKSLEALKADPRVVAAAIYSPTDIPFVSFSHDPQESIPAPEPIPPGRTEAYWIRNNRIVLEQFIVSDGAELGIVYIESNADALKERLLRYLEICALVLLGSLLAAFFVSSAFQKAVAAPIVHLAEVAKVVSRDKRYSLRVTEVHGQGEITTLIDAFNEMMEQIEQKEAGLQNAHNELEQRVQERTADLLAAQKEVEAYSESILRAKEDVERSSKFKDQFLSTMSHELRTPLNAVMGFSELLSDSYYGPLNERQQRYVSHIHTSGQHLLRLINDILDLSKIEAGRLHLSLENVPVLAYLTEVCDSLRPLADKKGQVLLQLGSPALVVRADSTRFKQIVMNLVGNAIKFAPEGGKIELTAVQDGGDVRIEVHDAGPGIPEEEQKRIFEAFHRLKQSGVAAEGTGLGLAITQSLVELHGGRLGLESTLGAGSCFHFTLPCASTAGSEQPFKPGPEACQTSHARILVIEDDIAAAYLLESQLASIGYEVVICSQPEEAVERAVELRPAAITLDIVMRPVNGWEVLSRLKSDPRTAEIPVVVVTVVDRRNTGLLLGADEYIVKPVDRTILLSSMERCLNHRGSIESPHQILVVEDDGPTREFVVDALTREGYTVSIAKDGAEARTQIQSTAPNLVILDLLLPEVSGFQLIAEWRSDPGYADIPIFVLTNKDLTQEEREYLKANTEMQFSKQDSWSDSLLKHIQRLVPSQLSRRA